MGKGVLVVNILTIISPILPYLDVVTAESSSGSMSRNLEELMILGLRYFWKKNANRLARIFSV
jgi:hypothetical protein